MKEVIEDSNNENVCVHGPKSLILVKMSTLPRVIWRFNAISIRTQMAFCYRYRKTILTFLCKHKKKPRIAKVILWKNKPEGITFPDFKISCGN